MRPHDLEALEYPRVLARVAEFARSAPGAAACMALRPQGDPGEAAAALDRTAQVVAVLREEESLPDTAVPDIAAPLESAGREGFVLDGPRLVEVRKALAMGRELGVFLRRRRERLPALAGLLARCDPPRELEVVLDRALDDEGGVRDGASDELAALRASLRDLRSQLARRLETLVRRDTMADVVAEPYVTIRNNRLVIPVKANYGQKLQGVVQDRSASGETLYLEPLFAVEMNNAVLMTAREEEMVVRRILADLTALVRAEGGRVADTFAGVVAFDVLAAKARFAEHYRCVRPALGEAAIDLREARHPILLFGERPIVPVEINLPAGKEALLITGPNTGGKTVALKTLGLLSLMAQSGLLIPAAEGSALPCWRGVYADVGDEQNIQRNLSTFSAHIANLVDIDRCMEAPALVLLDEPGVGTDPEEGAALAVGLLSRLPARGARVVATTHYTPVKLYGLTADSWAVAAVDFDRATLSPRYRLLYRSFGESLALLVAEQMGLAPDILAAARAAEPAQARTVNAALERLEDGRRAYEARFLAIEERERAVAAAERKAAELDEELRERRRRSWRDELEAARRFVREIEAHGRRVLAEVERRAAGRREVESYVEAAAELIAARQAEIEGAEPPCEAPLRAGDAVALAGGGFAGELVSVRGERAWIRRGSMRIEVPAAQLRRAGAAPRPPAQSAAVSVEASAGSAEVVLVGLRAKEALPKLDESLDRAAVAGHAYVRVVHGLGSGALRRAVHAYLRGSPYCAGFRGGEAGEGGPGVTIVELAV